MNRSDTDEPTGPGPDTPETPEGPDATRAAWAELQAQLGALVLLARAADENDGPDEVAARALSALRGATGASAGLVAEVRSGSHRVMAEHGPLPAPAAILGSIDTGDSSLVAALRRPGNVVDGPVERAPLAPAARAALESAGIRWLTLAGLHAHGEWTGILALAWASTAPSSPRVEIVVAGAATIGAAIARDRLVARLVASEERYRSLFDLAPIGILVGDLDARRVVAANEAAERLCGAAPGGLVGADFASLTVSTPEERQWRLDAIAAGGGGRFEVPFRRLDGTTFPAEVTVATVELEGERRSLSTLRDLSDQRRLERELGQAQKMEAFGQLTSGMAHEINNPLAAIVGFAQVIGSDPTLPDELRDSAAMLQSEADRTRRIVQNLLDFARRRPPERHPTSLRALVDNVIDLTGYGIAASGADIAIAVDVADALPLVPLDRQQLQQVLLNLVSNAVQSVAATGGPGRIRIEARADDPPGTVRLSVTDDGPGVAEEHRPHLFLPFFSTRPPGEGTGLGLSVSLGIVEDHGGRLWFEPAPGGGATFTVELPTQPEAIASPGVPGVAGPDPDRRPVASGHDGSGRPDRPLVLVVDDHGPVRLFLARALRSSGFRTRLVEDGPSALAGLRDDRETIAAVLCDYRMAGMSGTELFAAAVAGRPDLAGRFVFMSGDATDPELRAFAEEHHVRVLAKPFDLDTVTRVVREATAG